MNADTEWLLSGVRLWIDAYRLWKLKRARRAAILHLRELLREKRKRAIWSAIGPGSYMRIPRSAVAAQMQAVATAYEAQIQYSRHVAACADAARLREVAERERHTNTLRLLYADQRLMHVPGKNGAPGAMVSVSGTPRQQP